MFQRSLASIVRRTTSRSPYILRPIGQTRTLTEARLDSQVISAITAKEKEITGQDEPVPGGPTAQAQRHANQIITPQILHDITEGEKKITGGDRLKGGPTSLLQSLLTKSKYGNNTSASNTDTTNNGSTNSTNSTLNTQPSSHTGTFDSTTLHNINVAESKITGQNDPVRGGPTARAQGHANEPITSESLSDVTAGEKKLTGSEGPIKGGPTAAAQSELGKSRNEN